MYYTLFLFLFYRKVYFYLVGNTEYCIFVVYKHRKTMKTTKYTTTIEGNKVIIEKVNRTRTQYEYFLKIYMGQSDIESIHIYEECHLTKKSAVNEAIKAISRKPRIERVLY